MTTPKSDFYFIKIPLKMYVEESVFSNVADLHPQILLKNEPL